MYLHYGHREISREHLVQRDCLLDQKFYVVVYAAAFFGDIPSDGLKAAYVNAQPVAHDGDQLGVNFVLMLLVVL